MSLRRRGPVRPSFLFACVTALVLSSLTFHGAALSRQRLQLRETPIDRDHDGILEGLLIEGEADLGWAGCYWMHPVLGPPIGGPGDCSWVTHGMSLREFDSWLHGQELHEDSLWDGITGPKSWAGKSDPAGRAGFSYYFKGEDLADLRVDGPLRFQAGFDPQLKKDPPEPWPTPLQDPSQMTAFTHPWSWRQFAHRSVYGDSVGWSIDSDSSSVRVWVLLHVFHADSVRLRVSATCAGATSGTETVVRELHVGDQEIQVHLRLKTREGIQMINIRAEQLHIDVGGVDFGGVPHRWEVGPLRPHYTSSHPIYE